MRRRIFLALLPLVIISSTAYSQLFYSPTEYNTLYNQKVALELEIKSLRRQFDNQTANQNSRIAQLEGTIKDLEKRLADMKLRIQDMEAGFNERYTNLTKQNEILKQSGSSREKELMDQAKASADAYEARIAKLQADLQGERDNNARELKALRDGYEARIKALNEQIAALGRDLAEIKELNKQQKEELARMENQALELEKQLQAEIQKGEIRLKRFHDKLIINIDDRISFSSGSADLKPEILPALDKIKKIIESYPEYQIVIEGHTDNVPIRAGRFRDNWQLSTERALSVLGYILNKTKIDARRLSAAGYGEFNPIVPNDTPENRSLNRRVDIVVIPRVAAKK